MCWVASLPACAPPVSLLPVYGVATGTPHAAQCHYGLYLYERYILLIFIVYLKFYSSIPRNLPSIRVQNDTTLSYMRESSLLLCQLFIFWNHIKLPFGVSPSTVWCYSRSISTFHRASRHRRELAERISVPVAFTQMTYFIFRSTAEIGLCTDLYLCLYSVNLIPSCLRRCLCAHVLDDKHSRLFITQLIASFWYHNNSEYRSSVRLMHIQHAMNATQIQPCHNSGSSYVYPRPRSHDVAFFRQHDVKKGMYH